jgi:hypothetical protein
MKKLLTLILLIASTIASFGAATERGVTYLSTTKRVSPAGLWASNAYENAAAVMPYISGLALPYKNRFSILSSNIVPWRFGGFGDSLGDDVSVNWIQEFGRAIGWNGGYLTLFTNTGFYPLTYTHSGNVTVAPFDTNWFADHFILTDTADVTFDSRARFILADTFRVAVVSSTNGGTYKIQVSTNGGSFTDITGTLSALTAYPTGIVTSFSTNLGGWKLKVVNVSGTNVLIGGGLWASNRGGVSPSMLWASSSALTDVTAVHTNISVPILTDLALTEVIWHAADPATSLTNALPTFCSILSRAASNADITFVGMNQVTDPAQELHLGNLYIQAQVLARGYAYIDTEQLGTTNDLVRRNWVTDGTCVHLSPLADWYLSDLVWRDSGVSQGHNLVLSTLLGTRVPLRILEGYAQTTNLFEIANYDGTNLVSVNAAGTVTASGTVTAGAIIGASVSSSASIFCAAASAHYWSGRAAMWSPKDRAITFNSSSTDGATSGDFYSHFYGGQQRSNTQWRVFSTSINTTNPTINAMTGDTNSWATVGAGSFWLPGTNTISAVAQANVGMGAQMFTDGTNLVVAFQNAAGTRTTNKLSMTSWP